MDKVQSYCKNIIRFLKLKYYNCFTLKKNQTA